MAIGLLTLEMNLPLNNSLKGKRGIVKSMIMRLRNDHNISICEAEAHDVLRRAVIEVVCVSQNTTKVHQQLHTVAKRVEHWRMDAQLIDYHIEMID